MCFDGGLGEDFCDLLEGGSGEETIRLHRGVKEGIDTGKQKNVGQHMSEDKGMHGESCHPVIQSRVKIFLPNQK